MSTGVWHKNKNESNESGKKSVGHLKYDHVHEQIPKSTGKSHTHKNNSNGATDNVTDAALGFSIGMKRVVPHQKKGNVMTK